MAGKRYKYSFENKNHATKGVVSAVCAGISLGIFCVASLCSLAYHGNGGRKEDGEHRRTSEKADGIFAGSR